ncbi:phosphotransferase [Opitutales bacterium]|nr:phosphotransferase [Opitutales bacterium]
MDERKEFLCEWINQSTPYGGCKLEPASADGSRVVMDAPPELEPCAPFVQLAKKLKDYGIQVPQVYFQDLEQGFLVLSDFGDLHYQEALASERRNNLYELAVEEIIKFQKGLGDWATQLPVFDRAWQSKELEIFREWCLPDVSSQEFEKYTKPLTDGVDTIPKSFMHRDFHCRNLLVTDDGTPGIIDFQGAMLGPITYDLVSLLRDCYVDNSEDWIVRQVRSFRTQLVQCGLIGPEIDEGTINKWFDWAGLQRHLKCVGIFHRLKIRDGKPEYLADVPRVLGYVKQVLKNYPELCDLQSLVEQASLLSPDS